MVEFKIRLTNEKMNNNNNKYNNNNNNLKKKDKKRLLLTRVLIRYTSIFQKNKGMYEWVSERTSERKNVTCTT